MKTAEFWQWLLPRERDGKLILARWRMTDEQAALYPGAVRAPGPPEIRLLPETAAEIQVNSTAALNMGEPTRAALVAQLKAEKDQGPA